MSQLVDCVSQMNLAKTNAKTMLSKQYMMIEKHFLADRSVSLKTLR